jgi:ATP-dependent Lon protease
MAAGLGAAPPRRFLDVQVPDRSSRPRLGGLMQKVLAAHRAGLTEVILPMRNEGDLDDVPEQVREQMTFHVAESIDQVLAVALRG